MQRARKLQFEGINFLYNFYLFIFEPNNRIRSHGDSKGSDAKKIMEWSGRPTALYPYYSSRGQALARRVIDFRVEIAAQRRQRENSWFLVATTAVSKENS